ncbi:MAG: DUF378 domain-containing protein [Lysinibacillus sp.]
MSALQRIALILTIIGALNWGVVGLFNFDIVATLFGDNGTVFARGIYVIIGLAGITNLILLFKNVPEEEIIKSEPIRST